MYRLGFVLVFILCKSAIAFSQQAPPVKYTKSEIRALESHYEELQKEITELQKQRLSLENALKEYDVKLSKLSQAMAKTEEQIDFASGTFSYNPNFLASTRQIRAMEMSYKLKSMDVLSEIEREKFEFSGVSEALVVKYEKMKNPKSKER